MQASWCKFQKGPEAGIQKKYTSIKQHIEYLQVRYEQKQTT